jgi:hypothetical protein
MQKRYVRSKITGVAKLACGGCRSLTSENNQQQLYTLSFGFSRLGEQALEVPKKDVLNDPVMLPVPRKFQALLLPVVSSLPRSTRAEQGRCTTK